jgi:hypothetical protein
VVASLTLHHLTIYGRVRWEGPRGGTPVGPKRQLESTRTLLAPNHASLWVVIREFKFKSMP